MSSAALIAVGTAAAALAGVAGHLATARIAARRRLRRLHRRVESREEPALLTDLSGRVLCMSGAMRALAPADAQRVEGVLPPLFAQFDGALLYRMIHRARRDAMAVERVVRRDGGSETALALVSTGGDRLLWALLPDRRLAELTGLPTDPGHEGLAFPAAFLPAEGGPRPNAAFLRRFGAAAEPALARLAELPPGEAAVRLALPARPDDGGEETLECAVSVAPTQVAGEGRIAAALPLGPAPGGLGRLPEAVPVAFAEFDAEGHLLDLNEEARRALPDDARPGAPIDTLFAPGARRLGGLVAGVSATGFPVSGEIVHAAGPETAFSMALTRRADRAGAPVLAVLTDATERRRLEEQVAQSQKMEAIGKLAGGVAHDFNNVLTAITGHCDLLLLRKDPSHPDYADLMQIGQNANRAAALVRQLLAFSREQRMSLETLSLRDVVTETHYLLERLVGENVTLRLDFATDLWPVRADLQQIEQALMNLVVNARDAMGGRGQVTIACRNRPATTTPTGDDEEGTTDPRGDGVEITVADSGPGIDPAIIGRIFEPFYTTKAKGEGTGLGLSTVYGIVRQSGGQIAAENRAEGGARFRIWLPRAAEETPAKPAPPEAAATAQDLTGAGSILLVEDEAPVRAFARRALALRGYDVEAAASAEEALEILEAPGRRVDLVVSDVVMPGMDGPTFAAEARRLRPGLRLIFVSGYAEESFGERMSETEFDFLAKPFTLDQLTAAVKAALAVAEDA